MGIARAGFHGTLGQPSAQVIDGSLLFDGSSTYLKRTPSSSGNRRTFTISLWAKYSKNQTSDQFWAGTGINNNWRVRGNSNGDVRLQAYPDGANEKTAAVFRDTGWYHFVYAVDTTQSTANDRQKIYVNGVLQDVDGGANPSENLDTDVNHTNEHRIGAGDDGSGNSLNYYWAGRMSQVYLIDGQALGPENFGFTDPLTNTWKPKKYIGTFGTNGFYLPMDGNSPIGEDKSGNGNNWTPVNFNGSVPLDSDIITGGRPILNTTQGGAQAGVGVFGALENKYYTLTGSSGSGSGYVFENEGTKPTFNFIRGATYRFDYTSATSHPLRFATAADAAGSSQYTTGTNTSVSNVITITVPHDAPDTLYYYCTNHSGMGNSISVTTDETKADKYASNIVFASPLVGVNNDVCASIACTSSTKSVTSVGNAAASSSVQSNFYNGSFYFDGTGDALKTTTSGLAPRTSDFCCEGWFYFNSLSSTSRLFGNVNTNANTTDWQILYNSNGTLTIWNGSSYASIGTAPLKTGKWHHVAYVRDGATHKAFVDGVQMSTTVTRSGHDLTYNGLDIGGRNDGAECVNGYVQDVRFYIGTTKYTSDFVVPATSPDILPDTPSGVSGSSKLTKITDGAVAFDGTNDDLSIADSSDFTFGTNDFTIEFFRYKFENAVDTYVSKYGSGNSTRTFWFGQGSDGTEQFYWYNGSSAYSISSSASFPINRWSHLAAVRNSGTMTLYVDGVAQVSTTSNVNVSLNDTTENVRIGGEDTGTYDYNGFISNVRIANGSAVYTSNFTPPTAPLTNVTNTKLLCCQSNTSATEGAVKPGTITANGNAKATNFNPFITDINTVRGQESGYATLNPLDKLSNVTLSNGNLTCTGSGVGGVRSTMPFPRTGMWYVEYHMDSVTTGGYPAVGITNASKSLSSYYGAGAVTARPVSSARNLGWVIDTTDTPSNYMWTGFALSASGDTMQIAFNADKSAFYMGVNNSWWGLSGSNAIRVSTTDMINGINSAYDVSGGEYFAWAVTYTGKCTLNYGQKPFKFPPPDGFQPLNAANTRPETVISRPDQYVGVTTYNGNNSTNSVHNYNFKPDFVWLKARNNSGNGYDHILVDSVRGVTKTTVSNVRGDGYPGHEYTSSAGTDFVSFDNKGFTLGGVNQFNGINNASNIVAWGWKAGGNSNTYNIDDVGYGTATAAGLDGSLVSDGLSANTKSGFSIIKYAGNSSSGSTLSHGLSSTPSFMLIKNLTDTGSNAYGWRVYHKDLTSGYVLFLNNANAQTSQSFLAPNANHVRLNSNQGVNVTGKNYICYAWHDVPGLQKFGFYTGNNNADGPFIELGFRPAVVILKRYSTGGGNWFIIDSTRNSYNYAHKYLLPNASNAEETTNDYSTELCDIVSNGFKIRGDASQYSGGSNFNISGATYIYAAWAEAPTVDLYGGGANAR